MDRGTRHGAGAGSSAPCRCGQRTPSALPAAPATIAPPNRPVRAQDALSAGSPQRPYRAGRYPKVRTATGAPFAVSNGVRLAQSLPMSGDCGSRVLRRWSRASSCGPRVAGLRTALRLRIGCPTGSARLSSSARTARSSVVRVDRPAIHPHHNHVAAPPLSANSADRVGPMPFPARRHRLRVFY